MKILQCEKVAKATDHLRVILTSEDSWSISRYELLNRPLQHLSLTLHTLDIPSACSIPLRLPIRVPSETTADHARLYTIRSLSQW